ncbi:MULTISPECIES: cupin domain-containing protein [unclassified Salinibacterium]|uniref:cupin domain-containing protein n=1 Tax=unclassified Salinibacterium TaxID=2632331 RepID=UPI0018CDAB21|nr:MULTISPECIES: cupin domain-containing protein [unclassified Salinibacterium]MBH0054561.1 cupin domain-containing protein [Salinibacterium sp. SWN139]MBH0084287.1 cupin domain-containing protein [Salinibacterium sp. SWN167]
MNTAVSLTELAATELASAVASDNGRSALTICGGRDAKLRQTLMALRAGEGLSEHSSPGEATLQVIVGHIALRSSDESWEGKPGDLLPIPTEIHAVDALEDSVILLTVVKAQ